MMFWRRRLGLVGGRLMWLGMIAFWGLLIWPSTPWSPRHPAGRPRHPGEEHRGDDARRILDQRLAR